MDRTLNQLMRELQEIATAHRQIREYFQGDYLDAVSRDAAQYPLMVATLQPGSLGDGFVQVNIIITIADKYNLQEYRQINEIHSDCLSICNDIKITMQQYRWTEFSDISFTMSTDPFIQRSQDMTAGWSMNVSLNVFDDGNWCDLPLDNYDFENGTPIHSNDCQPALVVNSDFTFSREIPSGDTFSLDDVHIVVRDQNENILSDMYYPSAVDEVIDVTIDPCADATYQLYNTVPTLLQSGSIPSGEDAILTAPDGQVQIKKENDGTLSNEFVASGAVHQYIVLNNDITVNAANAFEIHATDPLDIRIHNQNGNDITPTSVTYNGNQHHVTAVINTASFAPVGATLMKTGQTTSYRTGDDGDIEAGRATSFTVLSSNNPFGNTNRFTDELGTQSYTKNIVIDWSTYNGSTVLGYYRVISGTNVVWNTAIDSASALSIVGFTSGWRLPNKREMENIFNYSLSFGISYSPFNFPNNAIWTSTTYTASTTIAYTHAGSWINLTAKSGADARWIACRTFTVTGTTIS